MAYNLIEIGLGCLVGSAVFHTLNYLTTFTNEAQIHKEISGIISNYDAKNAPNLVAHKINNFNPDKIWNVNITNKNFINAIEDLRKKNSIKKVKINLDSHPHNDKIVFRKDNFGNIEIDFTD